MVEAAQIMVRRDEGLKWFYLRLLRRRGAQKAKVAVARELLVRCYILLRDGIDYAKFLRRGVEARPARLATWAIVPGILIGRPASPQGECGTDLMGGGARIDD